MERLDFTVERLDSAVERPDSGMVPWITEFHENWMKTGSGLDH